MGQVNETEVIKELLDLISYIARKIDDISKKIKPDVDDNEAYRLNLSKRPKTQ